MLQIQTFSSHVLNKTLDCLLSFSRSTLLFVNPPPQPAILPFDTTTTYYEAGELVTNKGKIWRCKSWPWTWRCSQDGYAPGVEYNGEPLYLEAWEEALVPTASPSHKPSSLPSAAPSYKPSSSPSESPSSVPSASPSESSPTECGPEFSCGGSITRCADDAGIFLSSSSDGVTADGCFCALATTCGRTRCPNGNSDCPSGYKCMINSCCYPYGPRCRLEQCF